MTHDDATPSAASAGSADEIAGYREAFAAMLAALKRQQANIRRWIDTGVPADAEESRSISEQIDEAIKLAEDGR